MANTQSSVKGFFLYFDQYESIRFLSIEQKGVLLDALFTNFSGGEYEITDPVIKMAFNFIKLSHEQRIARYEEKSEKARQSANMRWQKTQCDAMRTDANYANASNAYERNANACDSMRMDATPCDASGRNANDAKTITITKNNNKEQKQDIYMGQNAPDTHQKKFVPPTLEEVQDYCQERGNTVDAQRFIDFYTSKGWMIGKNKVKDWKACVRTWEKGSGQGSLIPFTSQSRDPNRCVALPTPPGWGK